MGVLVNLGLDSGHVRSTSISTGISGPFLGLGCTSTPSTLTAVWVNDGGEKIRQDDLRCTTSESVALWGARNETLSAALF